MNINEIEFKKLNQSTWTPFLTLICFLPFLDTRTSDMKEMMIQVILLLIPAAVLYITTQSIRNRLNQVEKTESRND